MKDTVIRLLFDFFMSYMSPKDAVIATLGGWGLEATLWQELGVQKDNGWLIERSIPLRKQLIRGFPFHHVNQLKTFPRIFRSVKGDGVGVDFFHVDLCGTLEASYELIREVLPLVLAGTGKCLAVTVADQRRNLSHENFKPVFIEGKKLFGKMVAEELLRHLKSEGMELATHLREGVSSDGIARREYGFLVHLAKVFGDTKIERMERYVYHSEIGSNNAAFRMRTYVFHISKGELKPKDWVRSPIQLVTPSGCITINKPSDTETKKGSTMNLDPKRYPALAGMLAHASAEVKADFGRLLESLSGSNELHDDLAQLLAKHGFEARSKRTTKKTTEGDASPKPFAGERFGITDKGVAVKIFLLESEATCDPEAFDNAKEVAAKYLGINKKDNKGNTLGAHLARTKGEKFRPLFVKSVLMCTPSEQHEAVLSVMTSAYNSLGATTDSNKLSQEAIQVGYTTA